MSPRVATFLIFVVHGAVFGTWIAAIPGVKASLEATGAVFGLALMATWIGALVAQQVTGQLLIRVPSRPLVAVAAIAYPLVVVLPVAAPSVPLLAASLFVFGYANSTLDITMNAHGVALEERGGVSILSGLHGGWSLGGAIGALAVAAAIAAGIDPVAGAVAVAVVLVALAAFAGRHLGTGMLRATESRGFVWPSRAVLPLAALVMLIAFVQGGLTEWGGVYLDLGTGADASLAALSYAALSLGLFIGRITGDRIKDRIGSIRLIQRGALVAAVAIALFLAIGDPVIALVGMVVAGIGLANAIPQIFGAAGRVPPGGPSLSAVFTTTTLVFIVSPAIIGTGSDVVGIAGMFAAFAVASVALALAVARVPVAETNPRLRTPAS